MGTKGDEDEKVSKRRNILGAFSAFFFGIFTIFESPSTRENKTIATEKKGYSPLKTPPSLDEVKNEGCKKPIKK